MVESFFPSHSLLAHSLSMDTFIAQTRSRTFPPVFFYFLYLICYRICGPLFQSSLVLSCCTVISTIWLIGECMYRQRNYQRPELPISCGVDDQRGDWPPAVQVHQLDSNARNRQHHAACSKSMLESTCVRALNIDNDFLLATRLA